MFFYKSSLTYGIVHLENNVDTKVIEKINTHSLPSVLTYYKNTKFMSYNSQCIVKNCYSCLYHT